MENERESLQADIDKLASTIGCLENLDGEAGEDDEHDFRSDGDDEDDDDDDEVEDDDDDDDDIYVDYDEGSLSPAPVGDDGRSKTDADAAEFTNDEDDINLEATPGRLLVRSRSPSRNTGDPDLSRPTSPALSQCSAALSEESDATSATSESGSRRSLHLRGPLGDKVAGGRSSRGEEVTSLSSFPVFSSGSGETEVNFETLITTNRSYQKMLQTCLNRIELALMENRERQASLASDIYDTLSHKALAKSGSWGRRVPVGTYSSPYFKDPYGSLPPANQDTLEKKRNKAVVMETLNFPSTTRRWNPQEDSDLIEGVATNLKEQLVNPLVQRLQLIRDKLANIVDPVEIANLEEKKKGAQDELDRIEELEDLEDLIVEFPNEEFASRIDWLKISSIDLNGAHSAVHCQLRWETYSHPRFVKTPFTLEEDKLLAVLAENRQYRYWHEVSRDMGYKRSPWQCFERFQRKHNQDIILAGTKWTPEEDEYLREIVEHFRIGPKIKWQQVAYFIEGRTAQQCAQRYQNSLDSKAIGNWSPEEDEALLKACELLKIGVMETEIRPLGVWSRVAQMIPGRKAWQCRERFTRHVDPRIDRENGWTWEEDVQLVKAVKRAGTYAWIAIAKKYFPRRTDVMCMRRYRTLLTWKKQQQWISHLDPDVKRYADTYSHLLLDRTKNEMVRKELAERPWNMDGQEIPRPQYVHLFGKRSQSAIEKSMANRTKIWKTVRDTIKPKTHQEEEHILEMCSLFRESTPIREILRWISHTFTLKPTKTQIRENRKKEYVTMRCLDLEKQIATTLNRIKNNEVHQITAKNGRRRRIRHQALVFETETQEDVERRLNPLVLSALGVDVRTALWRANKLKLDWEKQERLLAFASVKVAPATVDADAGGDGRQPSDGTVDADGDHRQLSDGTVDADDDRRQPLDGTVDADGDRQQPSDGTVDADGDRRQPSDGTVDADSNSEFSAVSSQPLAANASPSSSVVPTAAASRPSRSSAREAKRLFPGSELRKLIKIQTQIERNVERQAAGKAIKAWRSIDLSREGDRMYNLTQEKLLRSVDINLLESGAAMLRPKAFGSPSPNDWLVRQRPPKVFPLSLIRVFPPSRVTVEGFKTLLRLRAHLRDRACLLWTPKKPATVVPPIVNDVGHLKRGAVNEFRKDNFLKVMRKLRKDGGKLSSVTADSVFSGYGAALTGNKKVHSRKRKRDGGLFDGPDPSSDDSDEDDEDDEEDENEESMDKESFIENRLARFESKKEKNAKRREASKEEARAEKKQKKIEIGILTPVPMAGGVAEGDGGGGGGETQVVASTGSQNINGVGEAGIQTVEIRTKGIGYHQTVQVDEVVEVAKALQRNDKIEDVVALNRSAKNLSVKEMLALKRGKMEKKDKIQKRVATRPIPGRDSREQLEINARRREKYAQRWEKIQETRKQAKKKHDLLTTKLNNQDVKPEHFLRTSYAGLLNAKQQPEYLLLRQRFRAIFLWPEVLAGHAPPQVRLDLPAPRAKPAAATKPATNGLTGNVVQIRDVSDQKDRVMRGRSRGGRRRGRGRGANVGMPSKGRKYVTSWEREQERLASLSAGAHPDDAPRNENADEDIPFAVSSLSEQTFQEVEDEEARLQKNE